MKRTLKLCTRPLTTGASRIVLTAALLLAMTAAHAQDNTKPDMPATPKAAKSETTMTRFASKGTQFTRSQHEILASGTRLDRSRLVDFMTLSAKRADMRYRSSQIGIENAYIEWMEGQGHKVSENSRAVVIADRTGKKQALPAGGQSAAATTATATTAKNTR